MVAIDSCHVSCPEPAIVAPLAGILQGPEVRRSDPRPANFQFAHRLPIVWTNAVCIDSPNIEEWHWQALLATDIDALVIAEVRHGRFYATADCGQRAGFGHSPALNQAYSAVLKFAN